MAAPATNFDRVTPYYDTLVAAFFGSRLKRAQAVFLDRIPAGASILVVGGGTGWLLEPLLSDHKPGRILYLDASARMLARASRRVLNRQLLGRVEFRLGDGAALRPDEPFDIVITPFVLDLFTAETLRNRLIPRLYTVLKPGGLWLITDFVQTGIWWQRVFVWAMIRFFRLTAGIEIRQLANWPGLMTDAGLTLLERSRAVGGMVSADVWRKQP